MKALITGITGMIGSHFAAATRARGWETWGVARASTASRLATIQDEGVLRCDIMDQTAIAKIVEKIRPDVVIHMAAQAFNGTSWEIEELTYQANVTGTLNVLRACRKFVPQSKVLLACSSAEYGCVTPADCPLKEERFLRPVSPYGVSKVVTECVGYQYFSNYQMPIFLPRLFIHVGTGHPPATAIQNFARQVALIAAGRLEPKVRVGNLETERDFIDVRDGVAAMMLLLEKGKPGDPTNICTGKAHKIRWVLDTLIEISKTKVEVVSDPALFRSSDEPILLGDNSKLRALGWQQQHTMRQTLEAVYHDWVSRI